MDIKIPSKCLILRRPIVSNFAETIEIATIFSKATFQDSKNVKE